MGGKNLDNWGPKNISRTYKGKLSEMRSNESFVLSLIRFFCTYGRTYVPPNVRTDVPKKIAMYLQTKVVRLEKLMEGSDLPVAA